MPDLLSQIGLVRDGHSQPSSVTAFIAQYSRQSWDDIIHAVDDCYKKNISIFQQVAQKYQSDASVLYHLLCGSKKTSKPDDCCMQADLLAQVLSVSITVLHDNQILGQWRSTSKRKKTKHFFFIGLEKGLLLQRLQLEKNAFLPDVQHAIAQWLLTSQASDTEEKKVAALERDLSSMRLDEKWQVVPARGSPQVTTSASRQKPLAFRSGEKRVASDCCESVIPVHYDDIHAIAVRRNAQVVVTGSKDTTIKVTNLSSGATQVIGQGGVEAAPTKNYKKWVTAATDTTLSENEQVFVGYRDGSIRRIDLDNNEFSASFRVTHSRYEAFFNRPPVILNKNAKFRNHQRITALSLMDGSRLLVGMSQLFFMIDYNLRHIIHSIVFRDPEWVYGFAPLRQPGYYAVIHGAQLSAYSVQGQTVKYNAMLLGEEQPNGRQRKFISAINAMPENSDHVAMSLFGGINKVVDVSNGTVLHYADEHASARSKDQRVWQALPWGDGHYLTCADDRTIKLWDIRARRASILTIAGHPGRVSTLRRVQSSMFVAGTCPDRPDGTLSARLFFYDMRKLSVPLKQSPPLQRADVFGISV